MKKAVLTVIYAMHLLRYFKTLKRNNLSTPFSEKVIRLQLYKRMVGLYTSVNP